MMRSLILLGAALFQCMLGALAQTPDPEFGDNGSFTFATAASEQFAAVARLNDGRLLLVGTSTTDTGSSLRVVRLLANGTADPSFGTAGAVSVELGDGSTRGAGVVVLSDGRAVVVGTTQVGEVRRMFAHALLANGAPDPAFSGDGTFLSNVSIGGEQGSSILRRTDGRWLIGGYSIGPTTISACIIGLTATGALDPTWGEGGAVVHNAFSGAESMIVNDMALDAAGQVVATGSTALGGTSDMYSMRFLQDGGLDPDYGLAGEAIINEGGYDEYAQCIALASDGSAYLVGSRFGIGGDDLVFCHLDGSGTVQPLAGENVWQLLVDGSEYATDLTMDDHGRLVLATTTYDAFGGSHMQVLRMLTTPAVDAAFGNNGWLDVPGIGNSESGGLLFQPDGKLVGCGWSTPAEGGASQGHAVRYGDIPAGVPGHAVLDAAVWPNPCSGSFTLGAGESALLRWELTDATGRTVQADGTPLAANAQRTVQLAPTVAPGAYLLVTVRPEGRSAQRLIVH